MNFHAGSKRNLTLVMDLYELTMSYNYFKQGNKDEYVYFDMFYRKNPDNVYSLSVDRRVSIYTHSSDLRRVSIL